MASMSGAHEARRRLIDEAQQAFERVRNPSAPPGTRPQGDAALREAVLRALLDGPGTGYDVVRRLTAAGAAGATAGEVYPTLQLLADEGLADSVEEDGRRRWSLSPAGAAAAELAPSAAPGPAATARALELARAVALLAQTAALVGQTGGGARIAESIAAVDEARRRMLVALARE